MIRGVIFDIDGTLIDSFEANWEYFVRIMEAAGYPTPTRDEYRSHYHRSSWEVIRHLTNSDDEKEIQRIYDIAQDIEYAVNAVPILTEGVREVFQELHEQYQLGVVSNRHTKFLFEAPLAEFKPLFSVGIGYEDVVNRKPHPEPLLLAASRFNLPPEECVYIGDAHTDIEAANAAGMRSIHYANEILPDASAGTFSFTELPKIIASL